MGVKVVDVGWETWNQVVSTSLFQVCVIRL